MPEASPFRLWEDDNPPAETEVPFVEGMRFVDVKKREPEVDGYDWLHGAAIAFHKGVLLTSWGHNKGAENTATEVVQGRRSRDGGATWSPVERIGPGGDGEANSHGVFLSREGVLWAFLARFGKGEGRFPGLAMEAFVLNEAADRWESRGVVARGVWPLQAPVRMDDGNWIVPGCDEHWRASVGISRGDDLLHWDTVKIPVKGQVHTEAALWADGPEVLLVMRNESPADPRACCAAVSLSRDYGRTWTPSRESNLPISTSKPLAGVLSTGQRYLIFTACRENPNARRTLAIAVSRPGQKALCRMWRIETGDKHLSYPYAMEHEGHLYVIYSAAPLHLHGNRNDCRLAVLPLTSLAVGTSVGSMGSMGSMGSEPRPGASTSHTPHTPHTPHTAHTPDTSHTAHTPHTPHTRVRQALAGRRPDRMPLTVPVGPDTPADVAWAEYRPDLYHLGEMDVVPQAGQVAATRDGRRKVTRDGGVWAVDARVNYRDEQDVLGVDLERFPVEAVDERMLAPMRNLVAGAAARGFPVPMHYGTLVTRATIEFGWEPFLVALALDPVRFGEILDRFGEASLAVIEGWAQTPGTELIVIHDDIAGTRGPLLSPAFLNRYVFPWHARLFAAVHRRGKKALYLSDGNYAPVLDDILALAPDGLYVESSSMAPAPLLRRAGADKLFLIKTNSQTMDFGTPEAIRRELQALRDLHQEFPGMIIYAGGGNPPPENAAAFRQSYADLLTYDRQPPDAAGLRTAPPAAPDAAGLPTAPPATPDAAGLPTAPPAAPDAAGLPTVPPSRDREAKRE